MELLFKEPAVRRRQTARLALCLGLTLAASTDAYADTPAWCERYDNQPLVKIESLPEELRSEAQMLITGAEQSARQLGVDAKAKLFKLPHDARDEKIDLDPRGWLLAALVTKPDGDVASLFLYSATSKRHLSLGNLPPWFEAKLWEPQEEDRKQLGGLTFSLFDGRGYSADFTLAWSTKLDATGSPSGPTTYSSQLEANAGPKSFASSFCSQQQFRRAPY
jgi:hypothetical protein